MWGVSHFSVLQPLLPSVSSFSELDESHYTYTYENSVDI